MYKFSFIFFVLLTFFSTSCADTTIGKVTGLPIPRFVIIKSRDTNMRSGPGITYPSKINYKCMFMPVEVQSEFEHWRLVCDIDGNKGWIHEAMLDGSRYVQIMSSKKLNQSPEEILLFRLPDPKSKPIARVHSGTIGKLIKCQNGWCQLLFGRVSKGWIPKNKLWGVYPED